MTVLTFHSDSGAQANEICNCFHIFSFYLPWSDETGCHELKFYECCFEPAFSLSPFTLKRGSLVPLHFLSLEWYHLHIWGFNKIVCLKPYYMSAPWQCVITMTKVLEHLTLDIQRQQTFCFLSSLLTISSLLPLFVLFIHFPLRAHISFTFLQFCAQTFH